MSDEGVARYSYKINVSYIAVGDGIPDVPKRHRYINLKFGLQFFPNKLTFPLDLPVEALDKLWFITDISKKQGRKISVPEKLFVYSVISAFAF